MTKHQKFREISLYFFSTIIVECGENVIPDNSNTKWKWSFSQNLEQHYLTVCIVISTYRFLKNYIKHHKYIQFLEFLRGDILEILVLIPSAQIFPLMCIPRLTRFRFILKNHVSPSYKVILSVEFLFLPIGIVQSLPPKVEVSNFLYNRQCGIYIDLVISFCLPYFLY